MAWLLRCGCLYDDGCAKASAVPRDTAFDTWCGEWIDWRKLRYSARILRGALGRAKNGRRIARDARPVWQSHGQNLNITAVHEHILHILRIPHVLPRRRCVTQAPSFSDASIMVNLEWTPQAKYPSICCSQPKTGTRSTIKLHGSVCAASTQVCGNYPIISCYPSTQHASFLTASSPNACNDISEAGLSLPSYAHALHY